MELLSPAGDLKSFYAAVYNRADAVYLGLKSFNARIKADNFTTENIQQIVEFAHIYNVKVYVTINILIKDNEVNEFLDIVKACVQANVDAFIIQDLGMAKLLLDNFQNIVLHASTQMGIHNLSGAKVLEEFGFKRVVLARETKLSDIQLIKAQTNLEIEYFIQGALCVAFSGNCYLSSLKNGNSGNRGKCLQLCRLPYKVFDGTKVITDGYFLSAKDLCLMKRFKELSAAGVDCLKIEGRLKRASYVAQVTRSYRQVIDNFDSICIEKEKAKISELFSRGKFNEDAYLKNNFQIINPKIGHHEGKLIGKVVATCRFKDIYKITLKVNKIIGQNDAIRFVQGKTQFSVGVGNVNVLSDGCVEIFSKHNVPSGCDVYLLKSEAKEKVIEEYQKLLLIDFYFTAKEGKPLELVANYGDTSVSVRGNKPVEKAKTQGVTYDHVFKQFNKLNGTKFRLNHLECILDNVFIPVSELNELRRNVIHQLEELIIKNYNAKLPKVVVKNSQTYIPVVNTLKKNFYLIERANDLENVDLKGFSIILAPVEYSLEFVRKLILELLNYGIKKDEIYLNLPIVLTETEMEVVDEILHQENVGIVANNYAHLKWVNDYKTIAGLGLNVYNNYTAVTLLNLGCENIVWSIEKSHTLSCGSAFVCGYPTLMTLCHCPVREVYGTDCTNCRYSSKMIYQDEKNNQYRFRRVKIKHCYFELFSEEKYEAVVSAGKIYDLRRI